MITSIAYLFVGLGAGLIGLRFLQSTLKVQRFGGSTTMGFLFSGIFLFLSAGTGMLGLAQVLPSDASLVGAMLSLAAAGTLALLLACYVLSLKLVRWHIIALVGSFVLAGILLAVFSNDTQKTSVFLFLLHAITLVPLFFVFHHYFLLSRNPEAKTKSFWLMALTPTWLGAVSVPLVFVPLLPINFWVGNLVMGILSIILLSYVAVPLFRYSGFRVPKLKISTASPEIMGFLSSF